MTRDRSLDVAVTGMAARFPGGSLTEWWEALKAGRVLTTRFTRDELLGAGVPPERVDHPDYVPVRGHLPHADRFDNDLFHVSPRDAELMDPQSRLMLEVAWAALEDAGRNPRDDSVRTGVYASASGSTYMRAMLTGGALAPTALDQALRGTEPDYLATRIAYKLGLTGPALTVQTACSSSLVALHTAVQALLNGECDQAVVVAAAVDFPQAGHLYVPGGILSASGVCRPFDADADGVIAGSGVVAVVLSPLADSPEGAAPHGVILGTAINNDGSAKAGYHAPSAIGQEAVIRAALHTADVDASSLGYLEAHATGTRVGDPIEWSAASAALAGLGARPGQVAVGAVKANIGHLDAAAGLASLVKALLVVKEGIVPPVAGFDALNPLLETDGSPLYVPTRPRAWNDAAGPRRAGVSSFGIGGTNAHAIIEQAPEPEAVPAAAATIDRPARERLVLLSAATPDALDRSAERLAAHLSETAPDLTDVAHTLAAARAELPRRLAVSGRGPAEIAERLTGGTSVARGSSPVTGPAPVVFLLPGQGTQRPGMAVPFAEELPGFSVALDTCLAAFAPEQATTLRRALLDPEFPAAELEATELAQPAIFALEYAAATALTGLGVTPAALIGHSLGEITAACLAGVLELTDAARFVTTRGRAMQGCPTGAMLALGCGAAQAEKLLAEFGGALEQAAVNGPDNVVVAGTADEVEAFRAWLGDRAFSRPLRTSHAFHSALVEPALPELLAALSGVRLGRPTVPIASNVTGRIVPAGAEIAPGAFAEQARRTVRFADALADAAELFPGAVAVEVGPGRALSAPAEAAGLRTVALSSARSGHSGEGPLAALGALWTLGQPLDVAALCGEGRRIRLPGYPFAGPSRIAPEALAGTAGRAGTRERTEPGAATFRQEPETTSPADSGQTGQTGQTARTGQNAQGTADAHDAVVRAWTQFLGATALIDDSDFFDVGGDSLLITRVTSRLSEELGIDIPVRSMLVARTLGGQATLIKELLAAGAPEPAETDYLEVNRALWDERVPIHVESDHYDVEGFRRGADPIREFELREVGDVTGLRLAHLQCHIGLDTLAWARRGARVTGLDFSAPAIEQARRFAAELGLDARFETADVYESEARLGSRAYDIVYTGVGALCWLPDIRKWAETVVSLLAPGGFLYLSEFHPFADTLGYDGRTVVHDYFDSGPQISDMSGTYADTKASTENSRAVAFQHGLGEVVSALVSAGLRIDFLNEHDMTIFQKFHSLSSHADGIFKSADGKPRVPLMYSLRATLDDRRGEAL
ncbi:acyltransferase domain-containing protein [Streptomyces sp. NBC_01255]|uniref:type I polyketide synthase n=1 Tax=Streptomyces sp. NBC_01255 TaxID=2903798 RepID=UPI002E31E85B|nr:beta-ketoacyl synthase N-terminal-like domain-containing protein [Streptomyces sp. NBC_01255]